MMEPQQYKSYVSPNELKNDKDVEIKDEPMEMTDEFLITEEYPDYVEAMDGDKEKHDDSHVATAQIKESEMEMTFYECEVCKAKFKSNLQAKRHEQVHEFDKPFNCQSCKISFRKRGELNKHMKAHEEASRYRCKECSWRFVSRNLKDRQKALRDQRIEICLYCGNELSYIERNDSVQKQVTENVQTSSDNNEERAILEETGECRLCRVTFEPKCEAERHAKAHSFDSPYQCYECENSYGGRYNLQKHLNTHKVVSQYRCKECCLQFTNSNERDHRRAFRNYQIKSCFYCGEKFSGIESNKNSTQPSSTILVVNLVQTCETLVDDNNSGEIEALKGNQPEHANENLEISQEDDEERVKMLHANGCRICNVTFESSFEAKRHENMHSFNAPWKCHECDKSYKHRHSLQGHMKLHKLASQHNCMECSWQFAGDNDKGRDQTCVNYHRIKLCFYCGNDLSGTEGNTNASQSSSRNICEDETELPSVDQHLSESIPVRNLPTSIVGDGKGRAALDRSNMTHSDTVHQLSAHELENLQTIQQEPKETKTGEFPMDESRSGEIEGEQQEHLTESQGARCVQNEMRAETYQCDICCLMMSSSFVAKTHRRIHTFVKPFRCHECDCNFQRRDSLRNHMRIHKCVSRYRCMECRQHMKANEKDRDIAFQNYRVLTCLYCGKPFNGTVNSTNVSQPSNTGKFLIDSKRSYNTDILAGVQQKQVNDDLEASELQSAERAEIGTTYQCEICCLMLKSSFEVERHKGIHTLARPFRCKICNITFKKMLHLQSHMKIHQMVSQCRCQECKFRFTNQDKEWYKNAFQNYQITSCLYCGSELPGMEERMNDAEEERKNDSIPASKERNEGRSKMGDTDECEICEIKFKSNFEAKRHENMHSFDIPYQCHICNFSYQKKFAMQNHMKHHKLVSEYRCKACSFLLISRSDKGLKNALRYRTKSCLYCGEEFPGTYIFQPVVEKHGHPLIIAKQNVHNSCWYLVDINTDCKLTLYDLEELRELQEESTKATTQGFLISGEHSARVDALEECKIIMGKDQAGCVDNALQGTSVRQENAAGNIGSVEGKSNQKVEVEGKQTTTKEFVTSGKYADRVKAMEECGGMMQEDQDGCFGEFLQRTDSQNGHAAESNESVEAKPAREFEGELKGTTTEDFVTSGKHADRVKECGRMMQEDREEYLDDALQGKGVPNKNVAESNRSVEATSDRKLEGESKETATEELLIDERSEGKTSGGEEISDNDHNMPASNGENEKVADVEKIHECETCSEKFKWEGEAKIHKISHANETPVDCPICNIKFKAMFYLEEHLKAHREVSRHRCKYCRQQFSRHNDKDSVKYLRYNWLITSCFYCGKKLPSKGDKHGQFKPMGMIDEEKSDGHRDVLINVNTICQHALNERKAAESESLSDIMSVSATNDSKNYGDNTVLTSILDHPFKTLLLVKTTPKGSGDGNERDSSNTDGLIITKSIRRLATRALEEFLINRQPSDKTLEEDMSKKQVFPAQPAKRPYTEDHHECEICHKRFKWEFEAKVHKLQHGKERAFDCQACQLKFKTLNDLQKHTTDHEEASRERCRDCSWRFAGRPCDSLALTDPERASRISKITSCFYCAKEFPVKQIRNVSQNLESTTSTTDKNIDPVTQDRNSGLASLSKWQGSKMLKDMLRVIKEHDTDVQGKDQAKDAKDNNKKARLTDDDKEEQPKVPWIPEPRNNDKKEQPKDEEPKTQSEIMCRYPNILPKLQIPVPQVPGLPEGRFSMPMQNVFMPPGCMPPVNFGFVQGFPRLQAFPQVGRFNYTGSTQQVYNNPTPQIPKAVEMPCACKTCGKLFETKREVVKHESKHHACRECGKRFRLKCRLDNHELAHGLAQRVRDKTTYICEKCGLSSTDYETIREHTLLHVEN